MKNLTLARRMRQQDFGFSFGGEITVDLFAGGGGASTAIERATGLFVDIACNHDPQAIAMHKLNHPQTKHYQADVYEVDPHEACDGRPVGLFHLSPDCTHHSQAAGGQPRDRATRSLSWVGKRWAGQVSPRIITLENVGQITKWGPLVAKRDKATGRVLKAAREYHKVNSKTGLASCKLPKEVTKTTYVVAEPGEVVPVEDQHLEPDTGKLVGNSRRKRKQRLKYARLGAPASRTWNRFVGDLKAMGYEVEWNVLGAHDLGAGTSRYRLFMVARRDGQPIAWPEASHYKDGKGKFSYISAADSIDFSDTGKSIFDRLRPLADATHRRIAKGIKKFVLDNPQPFIVPMKSADAHAPVVIQMAHGEGKGPTKRWGTGSRPVTEPLNTITASGGTGVATAYLMQANGGFNTVLGRGADEPLSTITATGSQQQLVTAFIDRQFGTGSAADITKPLQTIMTSGNGKCGLVECELGATEDKALRVAAFLINYYGNGDARDLSKPLDTITTKDRLALVTVHISGEPYLITDIRLRMLTPKELYKAQGFPDDYIFEFEYNGKPLSRAAQVRMCGNSVSPPPMEALIRANYQPMMPMAVAA